MVSRSTPDCSSVMARVCRKICGDTIFLANPGCRALAVATARLTTCVAPNRVSRSPCVPRKIGPEGLPDKPCSAIKALKAPARSAETGTIRSLRPLPRRRACGLVLSSWRSGTFTPSASDTLAPVRPRNSSKVRSRRPRRVRWSGAAISASNSARER